MLFIDPSYFILDLNVVVAVSAINAINITYEDIATRELSLTKSYFFQELFIFNTVGIDSIAITQSPFGRTAWIKRR